jgi:DNA adenine methylase
MKPFLRWVGGKRWLADVLVPRIVGQLNAGGRYVEPFLGAGAIALAVAAWRYEERRYDIQLTLGDVCEPLINTWAQIAQGPHDVLAELGVLIAEGLGEDAYYNARGLYNNLALGERDTTPRGAALFLYLNATGYNGVYRENKQGGYNVPYGKRKNPPMLTKEDVEALGNTLQHVRFYVGDFDVPTSSACCGDVVFADSPYDETFGDYTAKGFDEAAQERLARSLRQASDRGATIYATNADTPRIRTLYRWAEIERVNEKRSVAPKGGAGRAPASCVLIRKEPM